MQDTWHNNRAKALISFASDVHGGYTSPDALLGSKIKSIFIGVYLEIWEFIFYMRYLKLVDGYYDVAVWNHQGFPGIPCCCVQ